VKGSASLQKVLDAISRMKEKVGGEAPILGVVMSPFSLPVMQMGFDKYLDVMIEQPACFEQLMKVNEEFCVEWANSQLSAGATAIVYFDPVSSPTIISRDMYLKTGYPIACRMIKRIEGAVATHLASGRCLPIMDELVQSGTVLVGVSALEDLAELKRVCKKRMAMVGNLNAIEMRRWSDEETVEIVKDCIAKAGVGGGFILSDNHGEIPFQVPDEVLSAISAAVHEWGRYPLDWVSRYA